MMVPELVLVVDTSVHYDGQADGGQYCHLAVAGGPVPELLQVNPGIAWPSCSRWRDVAMAEQVDNVNVMAANQQMEG